MLEQVLRSIREPDQEARRKARERQNQLTKPPGSLGRLEELSVQLAGIQRTPRPKVGRKAILTMAGDHGVVAEGVSAYPQEVTAPDGAQLPGRRARRSTCWPPRGGPGGGGRPGRGRGPLRTSRPAACFGRRRFRAAPPAAQGGAGDPQPGPGTGHEPRGGSPVAGGGDRGAGGGGRTGPGHRGPRRDGHRQHHPRRGHYGGDDRHPGAAGHRPGHRAGRRGPPPQGRGASRRPWRSTDPTRRTPWTCWPRWAASRSGAWPEPCWLLRPARIPVVVDGFICAAAALIACGLGRGSAIT